MCGRASPAPSLTHLAGISPARREERLPRASFALYFSRGRRWSASQRRWSKRRLVSGAYLSPPPLLGALGFELADLLGQGGSLLVGDVASDGVEDLEVLLLEVFESRVQLLVPRVQHKHLEAQRGAGHHKVGHRNGSRDDHGVRLARDSRDSAGAKG
uniref:Uncharacterized protein n=1 Tax=Bionectria ochroleuca TaxID=29856 RepID=A0A8H7K3P5_BIOOC